MPDPSNVGGYVDVFIRLSVGKGCKDNFAVGCLQMKFAKTACMNNVCTYLYILYVQSICIFFSICSGTPSTYIGSAQVKIKLPVSTYVDRDNRHGCCTR